jgi:phosphoglycolate phosphatase-like HAD superfamily hydrolase
MTYELVVFDVDGTLAEVGKPARRFTDVCGVLDFLVDELE